VTQMHTTLWWRVASNDAHTLPNLRKLGDARRSRSSREFEAENSLTRLSADTDIPTYLLFHWYYVALLIPCLRQTSPTGRPASARIPMIWLSLSFDFLIASPDR